MARRYKKTLGLALGSGGPRGLAHIGVIKTLLKHNIPIDYLSGSSIGSWVGAHYALYEDIEKLEEFTAGKRQEKLFSFLEPSFKGGIIRGDRSEKMLNDWLGGASFKDLKIPLRIVATDLITGQAIVFDHGNLAFASRASMAVPGIFKPVKFNKYLLVDGGISNPVPDDVAKQMGSDVVVAVNLDFFGDYEFAKVNPKFSEVSIRTMDIMRQYLAEYCLREADFIVRPDLSQYGSWTKYFFGNSGPQIIEIGARETEKIIPKLKDALLF
ncbi:MAG: patatin-like phospholipase family protein [Candidatus Buchananbacteria bacterium]